jgi:hypothetical protein
MNNKAFNTYPYPTTFFNALGAANSAYKYSSLWWAPAGKLFYHQEQEHLHHTLLSKKQYLYQEWKE